MPDELRDPEEIETPKAGPGGGLSPRAIAAIQGEDEATPAQPVEESSDPADQPAQNPTGSETLPPETPPELAAAQASTDQVAPQTRAEQAAPQVPVESTEAPQVATGSEEVVEPPIGSPHLNENGEAYPKVSDPLGREVPFPEGKLEKVPPEQRVPWGRAERESYIEQWRSKGHPEPEGGWAEYDIHHIRPREYGGTNEFDNLVPVRREEHQAKLTPWWAGFKPGE